MMAVAMMGLGYGSADVNEACKLDIDTIHELRGNNHLTIKAVRDNPDEARAYLVQTQRDMAILTGFALSHSPNVNARDLRNIAGTATILARAIEGKAPKVTHTAPKPPPSRPA